MQRSRLPPWPHVKKQSGLVGRTIKPEILNTLEFSILGVSVSMWGSALDSSGVLLSYSMSLA